MPLFEAQFLIVEENIWFAQIEPYQAIQHQEAVIVKNELLIADDAEAAYLQACSMIDNLSEANFDGPGDITNLFCKGLSELREIVTGDEDEGEQALVQEIDYANDHGDAIAARVKTRAELSVFQTKH